MRTNKNIFDKSYIPIFAFACITTAVIYVIYGQTQIILKEGLRERLMAIASTAAIQINPEYINNIKSEADLDSIELKETITTMKKVRDANKNLKYIYIWRKTEDPNYLEFVADAEMLAPIDRDGNGLIEDIEIPPTPGEGYDLSQIPSLEGAFDHPIAQNDFIVDKWGTFLSGFAPIKDKDNITVAIIGIDVEVGDYVKVIRATFIPFVLLTAVLLLMLIVLTITLTRIWRSRVEIVKELDRQKDELLSIVSHQLATPVSSVKWYLEMLLDGDVGSLTKEQQEYLSTMQSVTRDLADLVSMILDVSRIQLGKMKVDRQKIDLNVFYKEILDVIEPKAAEKEIKLTKNMPESLPDALVDKRLTRMTIENMLSNAIKYTPKGGNVTLDVKIENNTLHCSVSDTGCGIPKADQSKIFGKLYRASNTGNIEGNGFGLYVAKGAIEGQGGRIWFESIESQGTTFYVEMPLK